MVDAVPGSGRMMGLRKITKIPKFIITILSIVILGVIAYFAWNHYQNHKLLSNTNSKATPSQVESSTQQQTNSFLSSKDYASYQLDRQTLAIEYITSKDYANAERVMNDVLANVPAAKINSASYSVLFQVERAKGNVPLMKKYLGLMIAALKAEGKNDTAAAAQQELDNLK